MSQVVKKDSNKLLEGKSNKAKAAAGSSKATPQKKNQSWFKSQKKTYNKSSSGGSGNFSSGSSGSQNKGTEKNYYFPTQQKNL